MIELQKQLKNWRTRPDQLRNRGIGGISSPQTTKTKTRSSRASSAMIDHHHPSKSYKRPTSSSGGGATGASRTNPLTIQYENQQMKLKIKSLEQQIHRTNRSLSRQSRSNNISQPIDVTARQLSDQNDQMRGKLRKTIVLVKKFFLSFRRLQRALHKREQDDISKFKVQFEACRHELRDYNELIERALDEGEEQSKRTRNARAPSGALSFQDRHNISSLSLTSNNNPPKIRAYRGDQQYNSAEHSSSTPTSKQAQNLMAKTQMQLQSSSHMATQQSPNSQMNNPGLNQNQVMGLSSTINNTQSTDNLQQQQQNSNLENHKQQQQDMAEQLRRQLESVLVQHRQAQDQIRVLKGQNNDLIKQLSKNAAQIQQQVLDLQHKQNEQKQINDIKMVENQQLLDQIDVLAKQNDEFRGQILQLSQRDQKNVESLSKLQTENDDLKRSGESSAVQIKQDLIQKLDSIEQPLFQRMNQLMSVVEQKEKELAQFEMQIKSLSDQSVKKIKKLEKELADTNVKQSQGKQQMKQLVEQLGTMHKKRNQELKSSDSDKKKMSQALQKATDLVKNLQTQNTKLKSNAAKEQNEKIKSLEKQNNESSTIIKSLNSENQKLINQNNKEKSEKAKIKQNLQKTVQDLKKQVSNITKDGQKKLEQSKKRQQAAVKKHESQIKKAKDQITAAEKKLKQNNDDKVKSDQSAKAKLNQHENQLQQLKNVIKSLQQQKENQKSKSKKLEEENNIVSEQANKLKQHKQKLQKDHENMVEKNQILQKQLADMESILKKQEFDKQIKFNQILKKISDYQTIIKQNESQKQQHIQQAENAKKQFDQLIEKMSMENNMKIDQLIQTMQKQHEKDLQSAQCNSNSKYQEILNQQTSKLKAQLQSQLLEAEKSLKQSQDQVSKQQLQSLTQEHNEQMRLKQEQFKQKLAEALQQIEDLRQENHRVSKAKEQFKQKLAEALQQVEVLRYENHRVSKAKKEQSDQLQLELDEANQQGNALFSEIQSLQKELSDNTIASLSEKEKLHTLLNKTKASHEKELQQQHDLQAAFKKQHNELAKSLKDRIKELETQLAQSDEQLIELEKKLMNQKNADKQSLEAQHKKEFEEQRSKNAQQRKKWEDEKQQLMREKLQAVKNLQNEFREENDKLLKQQSDSKDQQQQNLLKQLQKRDQQIDQLSNQMVDLKLKQSSLQSQIDEDQIKLQEKAKDIENYKIKLEKSQNQCKEIQKEKIKIQEENLDTVNELKKQIDERDTLIESANNQLQEYNMQKMFIKTSLKDLIKDCSLIANESGSFAEESFNADLDFEAIIKALRQEIDDLRQRVEDQSKMNISKLTENSARFYQEEVKKDNELKDLKQKKQLVQKENAQLKQQLNQTTKLSEQSKQMLAKAQENFQNLRKQTEISESKKQKYKERINVLENQVSQEKKRSEQMKKAQDKQFEQMSSSHQEKAQSLKEMWQKLDKLRTQNEGLNKQNSELIEKNKVLKSQKQKVEHELQKKEEEKESAENELKAYQGLSDRDMNRKDQQLQQLKADNEILKTSLQQAKNKQITNIHDIIKSKSQKQLQILKRAKYSEKSWVLIEQSPQNYLWIPQFELTKDQQRMIHQSIILQDQNTKIREELEDNYLTKIKELMQEKNQLSQSAKRGSDPGGFIGSLSIGGQSLDKQQIKDRMRANAAEIESLKLKKKINQLVQLIHSLPSDDAAKENAKKIVELREQNERLGDRYDKLQKELTNIEMKIEKNITPRAGGGSLADQEEVKTPMGNMRGPMSQTSDLRPPKRPASVRGGQLGALSPGASYVEQRPGTQVAPGEQFLFEQQSAMSIRSGSQAFQDIQTLMKRLQESEREIKESQNTQDLILASNRQLKKVILALEKKLKKISNKQGEAAIQHGRSVLAKFLKGCPYASKQLEQILIVAMNVLQFSQKQIAQIQESRVKLFGQPPKDDKKKKGNVISRMFQKKKK